MTPIKIIFSSFLAFAVYLFIKELNDFKQEVKIINAIHGYLQNKELGEEIDLLKEIDYMELIYESIGYYKPKLYRLIDWGYTNIVPPEVLVLIKPYIKE